MGGESPNESPNKEAPKSEGQAGAGFEDPQTLARLDTLDNTVTNIKNNLRLVQNTNWLIIIVLFVALLGLVFAAIYQFTGAIKADTASRKELTESVNELRIKVEVLNQAKQTTTPAVTKSSETQPKAP